MAETVTDACVLNNRPNVSGMLAVTTAFIALSELSRRPLILVTVTSLADVALAADDQVGLAAVAPLRAAMVTPAVVALWALSPARVAHQGGIGGKVGAALERDLGDRPASDFDAEGGGANQRRQHEGEEQRRHATPIAGQAGRTPRAGCKSASAWAEARSPMVSLSFTFWPKRSQRSGSGLYLLSAERVS